MKFHLVHHFDVERALFERHLNDPELLEMSRALPNLAGRELIEHRADGPLRHWRFRVSAAGEIPAVAAQVVKPEMLSWVEESTWYPDEHRFRWRIVPAYFGDKFSCAGTWSLHADGPGRTRREIEGELTVRVPLVGRLVEQFIVERVRDNFTAEAEVQRRFYARVSARGG